MPIRLYPHIQAKLGKLPFFTYILLHNRRNYPNYLLYAYWCEQRDLNPHGIATNGFSCYSMLPQPQLCHSLLPQVTCFIFCVVVRNMFLPYQFLDLGNWSMFSTHLGIASTQLGVLLTIHRISQFMHLQSFLYKAHIRLLGTSPLRLPIPPCSHIFPNIKFGCWSG